MAKRKKTNNEVRQYCEIEPKECNCGCGGCNVQKLSTISQGSKRRR